MNSLSAVSRHPSIESLMHFFAYEHLPAALQDVSRPFGELAERVASGPQNAETTVCLRKLLEAKDCAVRAFLLERTGGPPMPRD